MGQDAVDRFNLKILKRKDRFIDRILLMTPFVALYQHNQNLGQWANKDVRGALFVVQRTAVPKYQFIVVNRLNPGDLVENLNENFKFKVKQKFLMYRSLPADVSKCLWVSNEDHLNMLADLIRSILDERSDVIPPKAQVIDQDFFVQRTQEEDFIPSEPEFSSPERQSCVQLVGENIQKTHLEAEGSRGRPRKDEVAGAKQASWEGAK